MEEKSITLTVSTPGASRTVICDAVTLTIPDSVERPNCGGSVGIRRGHIDALVAIAENSAIVARAAGSEVFRARVAGGFAVVRCDSVTVVTDRMED